MTDEELIARLRGDDTDFWHCEAADRIEALVKERDQWIEHTKNAVWSDSEELKLANARVERLEAALRETTQALRQCTFPYIRVKGQYLDREELVSRADAALKGADHE